MNKEQCQQMFGVDSIDNWLCSVSVTHTFVRKGKAAMAVYLLASVQPPYTGTTVADALEETKRLKQEINRVNYLLALDPQEELERRIVGELMRYLEADGFVIVAVVDEEARYVTSDPATAMGHIFAVEEASLRVRKKGFDEQRILLIQGNGEDIISDHTYSEPDTDGFLETMDAFEPPEHA